MASQMPFTRTSQEAYWKALYEHDMTNVLDLTNESDIQSSLKMLTPADLQGTYPEQEAQFGSLKVTSVGEPQVYLGGYATQGWMTHAYRIEDTSELGKPTKTIFRTHFEGWPDNGVIDCYVLNDLVNYFDKASQFTMPLVHCKAGVGRTGTFISCLRVKQLFEQGKLHKDAERLVFDIINIILEGRKERGRAFVGKPEQFESIINYAKLLLGDEAPPLEFTRGQIARLITMTKKRSQEIFAGKTASAQAETKERAEQREYKH